MKNKIFIITIFITGILLRLYPVIKQPLWLDEIYSLYFASNFSPTELLFHLPESHPGFFYLILKFLITFSLNPIFLRLCLSTLPEIIGCLLIARKYKNNLLTSVFLLNPFFIHYAWQIRMYGLIFLMSIILISTVKNQLSSPKKITFLIIITNFFSFSFLLPSICLLLYLAYSRKKLWLFLIPIIILEFFISKGLLYKSSTELASWIPSPSFTNTPSVILTSLGFENNLNSQNSSSIFLSIIFYLIFGLFIYHYSQKHLLFFFTFTLPLLLTIIVSILFPFLSLHRFFYLFIPKISLFIPRFILPLSVVFYIYVFKKNYPTSYYLFFVLLLLWAKPMIEINFKNYYSSRYRSTITPNKIVIPPWENFYLPPNFTCQNLQDISNKHNLAQIIEKELLTSPPDCIHYHQEPNIIYIDQVIKNLENYQKQIKSAITECISKSL